MTFAKGSQLAQVRPAVTTPVALLDAPAKVEVTRIFICNTTGSAVDVSLFHDDDGSTYDQSTALIYQDSLAANESRIIDLEIDAGIVVDIAGSLGCQVGTANAVNFTVYGGIATII